MALWDVRAGNDPVLDAYAPYDLFGAFAVHDGTRADTVPGDATRIVVGCYGVPSNELRVYDVRRIGSQAAALRDVAQHKLPDGTALMDASGDMVAVSVYENKWPSRKLYVEWWDMQQQGVRVGQDVGLDSSFDPYSLRLSDDGRMVLINDGFSVRSWCVDGRRSEQALLVEGVDSMYCVDIADTLVVYGYEQGKHVCFCDYGEG